MSNQLSYTAIVNSNLILYAKGEKIVYNINVGTVEHGSATVSKSTAYYGDTVTFNCTVDEGYEFEGWYSDEGLTQLMSENNPYTYSVTGDVTLYPKIGRIKHKITFKTIAPANYIDMKVAVLDFGALTRTEKSYLKIGNYEAIEPSKVFDIKSASISSLLGEILTVEILCPLGMTAAFWGRDTGTSNSENTVCYIADANNNALTSWPYYWYQPSEEATFKLDEGYERCDCSAIAKEGIDYAYATTPTLQQHDAVFEAEVASGYTFSGWYSDEACTTLVSTDNPAYVTTPKYTTENVSTTSLTLYAKATTTAIVYNCSAVAGENVTSAAVSDNKVIEGGSVTFTATIPSYCVFDGWYTALTGGTKVSGDNPYTAIINSDTTLYAKATKKLYTITLNQPDHGRATVSATTAYYDDQVTFTCYPDAGWQLSQWR